MSKNLPPPEVVVSKLFELYGGKEICFARMEERFSYIQKKWVQNADTLGRILRAHLFVEHFLSNYISAKNPNLAGLERARLSFAQKIDLADNREASVAYLIPGIKQLNKIRNRVAHNLEASITLADRSSFLSIQIFSAMRKARTQANRQTGAKRLALSDNPIDVLEDFAYFAGSILESASHPDAELWSLAFKNAEEEQVGKN
jgi:hypothetical protein